MVNELCPKRLVLWESAIGSIKLPATLKASRQAMKVMQARKASGES